MKNVVRISDKVEAAIVEGGNILISSKSMKILLDSDGELLSVNKEKIVKEREVKVSELSCKNEDIEVIIADLLQRIGISAKLLGYGYLKSAIMLVYNDESQYVRSYMKKLYTEVARIHNTTTQRVERAIRHAIGYAWKRENEQLLEERFSLFIGDKPTNCEFIATIVENLRNS